MGSAQFHFEHFSDGLAVRKWEPWVAARTVSCPGERAGCLLSHLTARPAFTPWFYSAVNSTEVQRVTRVEKGEQALTQFMPIKKKK